MVYLGEIKKNSGADVQFSPHPSTVQGIKIAIVRGTPSQIESGVNIISQKIDPQVCKTEFINKFQILALIHKNNTGHIY